MTTVRPRQSIINPQPIVDDPNLLLDFNTLQRKLTSYLVKLEKLKDERNYIQMDKDMVENFYKNSQSEIQEIRTKIRNSESKIEEMENNHQIDIKVFIQKMKHLEFEKEHNNRLIEYNGENAHERENDWFYKRVEELKRKRNIQKLDYNDNDQMYIDKVGKQEELQKKIFASKQREFDESVNELIRRYEDRLAKLKSELELKLKAEIHELEERKNQHINELINKHDKSFAELKKYYNEITAENLNLIKALNDEIGKINSNLNINTKLVTDMKEEIKALNIPLENKTKEKNELLQLLRGFEKDKMSMSNLKSKLIVLKEKITKLEAEKKEIDERYYEVEKEKMDLEEKFDKISKEVRKHAEINNTVLRERLLHLEDDVQHKELELEQIIQKFGDNADNQLGLTAIKESIDSKNQIVNNLKYSIHHATKAYNDAIRVYEAKLIEFGIPPEELGFQLLETITSTMPAGLVAS